MKSKYCRLIIFALAALTLAGCRQTPLEEPQGDWISFGASAAEDTRSGAGSTLINTIEELQGQSFGIYGYKSVDDATNFKNVFSSDAAQEVKYTDAALTGTNSDGTTYTVAAGTWYYNNRQAWERAKRYRFRAYWPYTAKVNQSSNANYLGIEYKQVENYDLMVAYATRYPKGEATGADPTGTRRVPMKFHHALAGLRFQFKFKDGLKSVSDVVTGFYVQGLYLSGTLIYGEANGTTDTAETLRWNIGQNNFDTSNKVFSWTGATSEDDVREFWNDADGTVHETSVFENDRVVFAIPQTLNEFDYRQTRVYFTTGSGGEAVQSALITQNPLKLEPGKIYTFTLVISGSSVKVNVDIEDWTETQSNVDIYF